DRFQDSRLAAAGEINQDVIGSTNANSLAEFGREAVALNRLNGKSADLRLAPPALDGAVLIEIEDEHLLSPVGEASTDGSADGRLADTALRGRKGNNHEHSSTGIQSGKWTSTHLPIRSNGKITQPNLMA